MTTSIPPCALSPLPADAPAPPTHPLVAAVFAALETARTCASVRVPKTMATVAKVLAERGQRVLTEGGNPEIFNLKYRAEWISMRGVMRFPTLASAIADLNGAVAAATPTYHPAPMPTMAEAAKARVQHYLGSQCVPVLCGPPGLQAWTDGIVVVRPQSAAQAHTLDRHQSPILTPDGVKREIVYASLRPMLGWMVEQTPEPLAPNLWLGSDWSDGTGYVIVEQDGHLAGFAAASVGILRGCGASTWRLAPQALIPRREDSSKHKPRGEVLLAFRGQTCVGLAMPVTFDWRTVLARWQAFGAKPVTSWLACSK